MGGTKKERQHNDKKMPSGKAGLKRTLELPNHPRSTCVPNQYNIAKLSQRTVWICFFFLLYISYKHRHIYIYTYIYIYITHVVLQRGMVVSNNHVGSCPIFFPQIFPIVQLKSFPSKNWMDWTCLVAGADWTELGLIKQVVG